MYEKFVAVLGILLLVGASHGIAVPQQSQSEAEIRTAHRFRSQSQFDSSVVHFRNAANSLATSGHRELFYQCLNGIADNILRESQLAQADSILSAIEADGTKELGGDNLTIAETFCLLGYIRTYQDRFAEGIDYYNRSLAIRLKHLGAQDPQVAASCLGLGTAYMRSGDYDKALQYLESAKTTQERAYGPDHADVANTLVALGSLYNFRNEHRKAIDCFSQALSILTALKLDISLPNALCYHYLALSQKQLGEFEQAVEYERKDLEILRKIHGENHVSVAASLALLGDILTWVGDYDTALQYYEESLSIDRALLGPNHSSLFEIERKLARLYAAKGDFGQALQHSLRAVEGESRAFGELHPEMAFVYGEIGSIYKSIGDCRTALEYYRKTLAVRQIVTGPRYRLDLATVLEGMGEAFCEDGDLDSAATVLNRSLLLQDSCEVSNRVLRSFTYKTLGDIDRRRCNVLVALGRYRSSLEALCPGFHDGSFGANPAPPGVAYDRDFVKVLAAKGGALEDLNDGTSHNLARLNDALAAYARASEAIDQLRKSYKSEGSKLFLQAEVLPIYQSGLALSNKLYAATGDRRYAEHALNFAERSKSAVLLEGIQEAKARHFAGIADTLRQAEELLARQITALSTQVHVQEEHRDTVTGAETRRRLFVATEQLQRLQDELGKNYPAYADLCYGSRYASVSAVQEALDQNTCLIEYSFSGKNLHTFVIGKHSAVVRSTPVPQGLDELTRGLVRSIKTMDKGEYIKSASALYDLLIGPVAASVASTSHLIIVPDGVLYNVPFEVLLRPLAHYPGRNEQTPNFSELPYLLVSHEISYAFSATLFVDGSRVKTSPKIRSRSFAGFAPVFGDSSTNRIAPAQIFASAQPPADLRSITVDGKTFNELRYSEDEVRAILGGFKARGARTMGFFRSDATEDNFKMNAGKYSFLHIATHGYINDDHPDLSALLFTAGKDSTSAEDGVLYAAETYGLQLNADLVVLSSCESGIGRIVKGEGVMAMARGFSYAGARNLVFSLWKVSDKHADQLMQMFYRYFLGGENLSSALRSAKLNMVRNEATAFPLKWAGFVLLGGYSDGGTPGRSMLLGKR